MKSIFLLLGIGLLTMISCSDTDEAPNMGPDFSYLKNKDTVEVEILSNAFFYDIVPDWHGEVGQLELISPIPEIELGGRAIHYQNLKVGIYPLSITAKNKFGEDRLDLIFQARFSGTSTLEIVSGEYSGLVNNKVLNFHLSSHTIQGLTSLITGFGYEWDYIGKWKEVETNIIEGQFNENSGLPGIKSFRISLNYDNNTGIPTGSGDLYSSDSMSESNKIGQIKLHYGKVDGF